MTHPPRQSDLFPATAPKKPAYDRTPVTIELVLHRETAQAWLLSKDDTTPPQWIPKALAERADTPSAFVIPRHAAHERGWFA